MWKVTRTCDFGIIGEDEFYTFEEAKIRFRHIIKEKLGDGVRDFTKQIEGYCQEFYPDNAPEEITLLINFLIKLVTDPDFPGNEGMFKLTDFEDDNIEFYIDPSNMSLNIYVKNEEVITKFPQAEINVIQIDDPDVEYCFCITDNKSPSDDEHYAINFFLWNTETNYDDDEEFDDEEFEDDGDE